MFNMRTFEREAVTVAPDAPVQEVADVMDAESVGCVVVADASGAPVGQA